MASLRRILANYFHLSPAVSLALLFFYISRFITLDTSYLDVYANTSWGMPLYYRLAASLVNVGGIMLYIAAILGLMAVVAKSWRLAAASHVFLLAAFYWGAFAKWGGGGPGIGLNPLLRNPWALPHPLMVIASYAMVLAAVAEPRVRERAGVLAWVFSTAGLAAGGYWSYTTFGWGGYWAWDPVETSVFIKWLFLTAWIHGRGSGALYAALGAVFLTMAVTYSGVSPLHSFAGVAAAGKWLLITSVIALIYGLIKASWERGSAFSYLPPLVAGAYIYWIIAGPMAAQSLGLPVAIPSGDSAVALIHPLLIPAVLAAFFGMAKRAFPPRAVALYMGASAVASLALVSMGILWSPLSSLWTNVAIYLIVLTAPLPIAASLLKIRKDLAELSHIGFAVLAVGAALSGPYAYHMQYGVVVPLGVGQPALVPLPSPYGPEAVSIKVVEWRAAGPWELVSIPPYLSRLVSPDLAGLMGVWGLDLRFDSVVLNGTKYVVAFGNYTPGFHRLGSYWLYVNSTVDTPRGKLLVAALGIGDRALVFSPQKFDVISAVVACKPNATSLNLIEERVILGIDGAAVEATIRYEASGEFKLIRGLIHGIATVPRGLDDVYIAVTPEVAVVGNVSYTRIALELARRNLNACLPLGAWMLLSAYSGRPLSGGEVNALLKNSPQGYVAYVKIIPMVQLVWIGAALLVAGGLVKAVRRHVA
nr:heme lyase CcmF/NrfE family subunit [Pyrobaculum sp.]